MQSLFEEVYYSKATKRILDYFHFNNIPIKLILNDGEEKIVKIISYDKYNIICKEEEKYNIIPKHSIKNYETEIKLDNILEEYLEDVNS